jgi:hypothetical protein
MIKMKTGLRNSSEDHVHFHDCFTDHRGWIGSKFSEICFFLFAAVGSTQM